MSRRLLTLLGRRYIDQCGLTGRVRDVKGHNSAISIMLRAYLSTLAYYFRHYCNQKSWLQSVADAVIVTYFRHFFLLMSQKAKRLIHTHTVDVRCVLLTGDMYHGT